MALEPDLLSNDQDHIVVQNVGFTRMPVLSGYERWSCDECHKLGLSFIVNISHIEISAYQGHLNQIKWSSLSPHALLHANPILRKLSENNNDERNEYILGVDFEYEGTATTHNVQVRKLKGLKSEKPKLSEKPKPKRMIIT